jgi:hypothetical protein
MLDIMHSLPHPNSVPCRWCADAGCGCGISLDGESCWELGTHSLRFMLHEPGWPVRLDMDGSWVPMGMHPAPAEDLPNGFLPAESDNTAEDTMHAVRAADDLVAGLGLDRAAGPWLDRVIVRIDPELGPQAAVCSAHTVVPYGVVAGHDPSWRHVEFGQVAVPGATVMVEDTWITTHRANAWDVEELAVPDGSPVNVVWLRLTLAFPSGKRVPSGLVVKLPPGRVVFGSPIPEQVRDQRVRVHGAAA